MNECVEQFQGDCPKLEVERKKARVDFKSVTSPSRGGTPTVAGQNLSTFSFMNIKISHSYFLIFVLSRHADYSKLKTAFPFKITFLLRMLSPALHTVEISIKIYYTYM